MIAGHPVVDQQANRRQRRVEFVRGAGGERAQRRQRFVADRAFARFRQAAPLFAHDGHEPAQHHGHDPGREQEIDPHAGDVQLEIATVQVRQLDVVAHQPGVQRRGQHGQAQHRRDVQADRRQRHRHQIQRNEGIGRAAGEIQQRGQRQQIHQQLQRQRARAGLAVGQPPPMAEHVEQQQPGRDRQQRARRDRQVQALGDEHHGEHLAGHRQIAQVDQQLQHGWPRGRNGGSGSGRLSHRAGARECGNPPRRAAQGHAAARRGNGPVPQLRAPPRLRRGARLSVPTVRRARGRGRLSWLRQEWTGHTQEGMS
ncbi:hypothetical protein FE772_11085 [Lysobacter enzymogenes]|nr:hypothetical protein FE772_11085 [Lysobacter enzymogenes]